MEVQLLLDHGADVDAKSANARTPLHAAARNDHKAVVRLLLGNGADANAETEAGRTSLHLAVVGDHPTTAEILRSHSGTE